MPPRPALCLSLLALLAACAFALLLQTSSTPLPWGALWHLRLPRVLAAAGVGALLALAGLAMQAVLHNPLADPYILGSSGGAAVGALVALLLGVPMWWGAGGGSLASVALLLLLARSLWQPGSSSQARLILLGAMLAALTGALTQLLLTWTADSQLRGALFWMGGDFSAADDHGVCLILAAALACGMRVQARRVDRLLLGQQAAALLGEPVVRLRVLLLLGAALAVAASVVVAGMIGFVGLVVPHALRLLGVRRTRELALAVPVLGAALVVFADALAHTIGSPLELPVGALLALLGAPLFIFLLRRDE